MLGVMSDNGRSPDLSALVAGCGPGQLRAAEGQAERLAQVAIRHADNHRTEIEAGLAASA
jgi:hypothetical protein